jgi:hypothetical protein
MYELPAVNNQLTKSQLKFIAEDSVERLTESGKLIESIETFTKIDWLIKEIKSNHNYIEALRDEVSKHGKQVVTSYGTKIELAEVGTKYDYTNCGDLEYNQLMQQMESLETAIKERQTWLKSLPASGMDILIEDEICRVYPPSKSSTSSIKTTIAK